MYLPFKYEVVRQQRLLPREHVLLLKDQHVRGVCQRKLQKRLPLRVCQGLSVTDLDGGAGWPHGNLRAESVIRP